MPDEPHAVVVIGAGPAGLTAAYELTKHGRRPMVIEKLERVGGLARTEQYRGFRFDLGGHRFFTKVPEVKRLWHEVLGDDFLRRPRLSRIYYDNKFFRYPLEPWNALRGLGLGAALLNVASYLWWQVFPHRQEKSFEHWVTNRFGRRLFRTFFRAYTEKVWGVSCSELSADWAAQRIRDLSLRSAIVNAFIKRGNTIKTLIDEFEYPRRGPGMMWEAFAERIEHAGGEVRRGVDVVKIGRHGSRVTHVQVCHPASGDAQQLDVAHVISSMPITELVAKLDPSPPEEVLAAADCLTYRDFLTVCLIIDREHVFPDNWIYVHDPEVMVGRIQNYKNWSPEMVADRRQTALGLEYFCNEGDALWTADDSELIARAQLELAKLGLVSPDDVRDGCVVRVPKAYPVYDSTYREHLDTVRNYVDSLTNLVTIGRNGLHRYNNQDHAMLTGLFAARNLVANERHDIWTVNTDADYHEEVRA